MEVGSPRRIYRVEPVRDPVPPRREPVEEPKPAEPAEPKTVPAK
jgi:hypothetical protein